MGPPPSSLRRFASAILEGDGIPAPHRTLASATRHHLFEVVVVVVAARFPFLSFLPSFCPIGAVLRVSCGPKDRSLQYTSRASCNPHKANKPVFSCHI